jgi:hypothetical protein
MANDKTYDRHINIWINGKEVKNDISSIKKEMLNLTNELGRTTRGTQEYNDKVAELKKVKGILKEHQESIAGTSSAWNKIKSAANSGIGIITAGVGGILTAYNSIKTILFSTDALGDKVEKTLGGWKGGIDAIVRSIASADFKNFGKNIKDAIEEGRRYAEKQDEISDKLRALKFREAEVSSELLKMREIENSALSKREDAIAAGKKAIELEDQLALTRTAIAKERYNIEMDNAMVITGQAPVVVEAYLRQDEKLMALLETGKKWLALNEQIKALSGETAGSRGPWGGNTAVDNSKEIKALQEQQKALGDNAAEYAGMFTGLGKLVDEKKDVIVQAFSDMKEAETSNLENTMKVRTKTDNLIAGGTKTEEDAAKKKHDQEVDADKEGQEFIDKEIKRMEDEVAAKRKYDVKAEKESQDFIDAEIKRMEDEAERKKKIDDEYNAKLLDAKKKVAQDAEKFATALFARQAAKLEAQYKIDVAAAGDNAALKAKIDEEYAIKKHKLAQRAAIFEKAAAIASIAIAVAKGVAEATAAAVVTLGASLALIPWIIAAGILQTAAVVAQPIAEFAKGGYTGPGGQHEPAGFVHKGEWVANADMVASPRTGPIIQALEYYRNNNMPGYSNGGMAAGSGGSGAGGSVPAALIATDPEMKAQLGRLSAVLDRLERNGVKNNWPWNDVNNMRKGMNKLDEIEENVS